MSHTRREDSVIKEFVSYIADKLYPGLQITAWPDKRPGAIGEIDAIAESAHLQVAIEHTSVDYQSHQRDHDDRFQKVFVPIEEQLKGKSDLRVRITVPFGTIPTGVDWNQLKDILLNWILKTVPELQNVWSQHRIPSLPFIVSVSKPTRAPHLHFVRSIDDDPNFAIRVGAQINQKAKKLKKYKESGCMTVLLLENSDLANMNKRTMVVAVKNTYPSDLPSGLDKVWYADTSSPDSFQFYNLTPKSRNHMYSMSASEELDNPAD